MGWEEGIQLTCKYPECIVGFSASINIPHTQKLKLRIEEKIN
jgi:hypothetical protein